MTDDWAIQVNMKTFSDTLINVRGVTPLDVQQRLQWVVDNAGLIINAEQVIRGVSSVPGTVVAESPGPGYRAPAQQQEAPPREEQRPQTVQTPDATSAFAPLKGGQRTSERGKFGQFWEYNEPDAPMTPHGPAVKGTKNKKDGSGTYTKWFDPSESEAWFTERRPKVPTQERWESQWVGD